MPGIDDIMGVLSSVQEPELGQDLVSLNMIRDLKIDDGEVSFTVMLTTPACPLKAQIQRECEEAVRGVMGVEKVQVKFDAEIMGDRRMRTNPHLPFANTVAVASGKGGVGKTTVAVNLAIALSKSGASVGLLDADLYGPNIPIMMGVEGQPRAREDKILPFEAWGIRLMSMGFFVAVDQPVVWRGPMLHSAIQQFMTDVLWGPLDYLLIDMPPGTGDVQLSLSQIIPLTGAVIVTTPQDVALADVLKGVSAFQQLRVPILGVVENMSGFVCSHCGERTDIFSHGGGKYAAENLKVPFLGEIAIDPAIRAGGDDGHPITATGTHSPQAKEFMRIAEQLAARLSVINFERRNEGLIQIRDIPISG